MSLHHKEFPKVHVPDCIRLAYHKGLIVDISWHNDAGATFVLPEDADADELTTRLCVSHEDPAQREGDDYDRFCVSRPNGDVLYSGDDAEIALQTLLSQAK